MLHLSTFLEHAVNTRGFSATTAATYSAAILDLERTIGVEDPGEITAAGLDLYMTRKALKGTAASTRRARGHAIKSFFRFLESRGLIPENPALAFRPPDEQSGAISTFTEREVERLIFYRRPPAERGSREPVTFFAKRERVERLCALRDSALLGLCYAVGLRSGEVAGLRLDAVSHDEKGAAFIALFGKGAKSPKIAPIDRRISGLLDEYLIARKQDGITHPALFCQVNPSPRAEPSDLGINLASVCNVLARRVAALKIDAHGRRLTPHVFRYTRATHLYEAGMPLLEIRDFLRHRSVETTMRYIRLGSTKSIDRRANAKLPWNRPQGTTIPSAAGVA